MCLPADPVCRCVQVQCLPRRFGCQSGMSSAWRGRGGEFISRPRDGPSYVPSRILALCEWRDMEVGRGPGVNKTDRQRERGCTSGVEMTSKRCTETG